MKHCSRALRTFGIDGESDWPQILLDSVAEYVATGEIMCLRGQDLGGNLKLQLIESEDLDTFREDRGIELNRYGAPTVYHLVRREQAQIVERYQVESSKISRLIHRERVRQLRGTSLFSAAALSMQDIQEIDFNELQLLKTASLFGLYLKRSPNDPAGAKPLRSGLATAQTSASPASSPTGAATLTLAPRMIHEGSADPTVINPATPPAEYQKFRTMLLQGIAARFGIPYTALSGDTSQANYAAMRGEEMHCRPGLCRFQRRLARAFEPMLRDFLLYDAVQERIVKSPEVPFLMGNFRWQFSGWEWVDPNAEAKALESKRGQGSFNIPAGLRGRGQGLAQPAAAGQGGTRLRCRSWRFGYCDAKQQNHPGGSGKCLN